jgi:cytochrome c biogenesis protein CcdA
MPSSSPHAAPAASPTAAPAASPAPLRGIDPRGPRFVAGITTVFAVVALLLGTGPGALVVLAVLAVSFGLGVARGVTGTWQSWLFRRVVRPRLAPPAELEDPRPPRFAQLVGLVISGLGLALGLLGVGPAIPVAAAFVLVASFLNAVFGLCLGCEMYLLGVRLRAARA